MTKKEIRRLVHLMSPTSTKIQNCAGTFGWTNDPATWRCHESERYGLSSGVARGGPRGRRPRAPLCWSKINFWKEFKSSSFSLLFWNTFL